MKLTLLSLIAVVSLAFSSSAQTNTTVPDPVVSPFTVADNTNAPATTNLLGPHVGSLINFFSQTGSNWSVAPFMTYLSDEKEFGGGIAATYSINDYAGAMIRLDYFDEQVFMPSGNFQLQLPINIAGRFQLVPFLLTGVATSLNDDDDEGDVIGIVGSGIGLRVSKRIGLVYDVEYWTSHSGLQHRAGVLFRF